MRSAKFFLCYIMVCTCVQCGILSQLLQSGNKIIRIHKQRKERSSLHGFLIWFKIYRCIGIYYPKKMRDEKFQRKTYVLIFLCWFFAYFPFLVTMSGLHNVHGYTCYTRKCSVLNEFNFATRQPQTSDKSKIGVLTTLACMLLLVVLNALIYRKLYVSLIFYCF